MEITHNGIKYKLDTERALLCGALTNINNPKRGEIWRQDSTDLLIVDSNHYFIIEYLENGNGIGPTSLSPSWIPDMKFIAKNLKEYYAKK